MVEPVEAQNKSELPSVVEPIETQNNHQVWFITYGKDHQGLIIYSESEFDYPYYSIHSALMSTFTNSNDAILILEGYTMALIKHFDFFYLFDSHARNYNGMPDANGTAVVMTFKNITDLEQYLHFLSRELNTNLFEISPIQLHVNICEGSKGRARLEKDSKYHKTVRLQESPCERENRLQKMTEAKKRKLLMETDCEKKPRLNKDRESKKKKTVSRNGQPETNKTRKG